MKPGSPLNNREPGYEASLGSTSRAPGMSKVGIELSYLPLGLGLKYSSIFFSFLFKIFIPRFSPIILNDPGFFHLVTFILLAVCSPHYFNNPYILTKLVEVITSVTLYILTKLGEVITSVTLYILTKLVEVITSVITSVTLYILTKLGR